MKLLQEATFVSLQAYVAEHLKKYGISLEDLLLQIDNGSENIDAWRVAGR